jgi:hypothetical protein
LEIQQSDIRHNKPDENENSNQMSQSLGKGFIDAHKEIGNKWKEISKILGNK